MKTTVKTLILVIATALTTAANAANLKLVKNFENSDLQNLKKEFQYITEEMGSDQLSASAYGAEIKSVSKDEKVEQTIKQLIYKVNTDYSTPEGVDIDRMTTSKKSIKSAIEHALNWSTDTVKQDQENLIELAIELLEGNANIKIFAGGHGNSFGTANFIALVAKDTNEILVLETSYAE